MTILIQLIAAIIIAIPFVIIFSLGLMIAVSWIAQSLEHRNWHP